MQRVDRIIRADQLNGRQVVDRVALDHDHRHRRRIVLQTVGGDSILLDLPQAEHLKDGDGLCLDGGGVVLVSSVAEDLLDVTAPTTADLVRIAWHLGNRHLPTQLLGDRLRIRADHVIADMVRHLGGAATPVFAPFDPERGAYAGSGGHRPHRQHDDGHDGHDHGHDHHHGHAGDGH